MAFFLTVSTLLSAARVVCITGAQRADSYIAREPLQDSTDVHDDVLNYTFGAREFGAPWGHTAATNADVGISFGIFNAKSNFSDQWTRSHFDPWAAYKNHPSIDLQDALEKALVGAAGGSEISSIAVFTHGFLDNGKGFPRIDGHVTYGSWPAIAAAMYVVSSPQKQIGVAVDWEAGASGLLRYARAMSTTRVVGLYISQVLKAAYKVFGSNLQTWCVGQSLGAHACGIAGKYAKISKIREWDVISALDPAGPSVTFLRSASTSFVDPAFTSARLSPTDAAYTEVLHTDWGGLGFHSVLAACIDEHHWYAAWNFQGCSKMPVRLGHLEAYANPLNYTAAGSFYPHWLPDQAFVQPGCPHAKLFCSHHFSKNLLLFALSQRLQGGAFSINSTCGAVDMTQEPLNLCSHGERTSPIQILLGPLRYTEHSALLRRAYSFDGHEAPSASELASRFPETLAAGAGDNAERTVFGDRQADVVV